MFDKVFDTLAAIEGVVIERGDVKTTGVSFDAVMDAASLREFVMAVYKAEFMVESVTAVDATPKMMVIHHFSHPDRFCRIASRVLVSRENPECPSICDIFQGANWHERETHDFYGIKFAGHPDLSPLILPDDAGDLNPMLKSEKGLKELGAVLPRFAPPAPPTPPIGEVAATEENKDGEVTK